MRDLIARLAAGDDEAFELLMRAVCQGKVMLLARPHPDDERALVFANYLLDDMNYIPLFTDQAELDEFDASDTGQEWQIFEIDGNLFAETMSEDQFLLINPVSGGIMFQGAHLKPFIDEVRLDNKL